MTEPVSDSGGLVGAPPTLADVARVFWTPAPELVAKLPRVTCRDCSDKRTNCTKHKKEKCSACGAFISTQHIHLDYVGHPDVTRTLTEIDEQWNWEPFAIDADGLPFVVYHDGTAEMWGRLTLLGVTRICVGSCDEGKTDRAKELVGDLIRNGAMRHNIYGSLWSKAERDGVPEREEPAKRSQRRRAAPANENGEVLATKDQEAEFAALLAAAEFDDEDRKGLFATHGVNPKAVTKEQATVLIAALKADGWETVQRGDGGWEAHPAGTDAPFVDEPDAAAQATRGTP